jgi:hypothetical protein
MQKLVKASYPVFQPQRLSLYLYLGKKTITSKPRHLWEQPLAFCPALCNQPVLTPTREEGTALVNPLVYQAGFPGCSRETNCCSRKAFRKPLAPGGSCSSQRCVPSSQGLPLAAAYCPFKSPGLGRPTLHALSCPPRGLRMSLAEQRGGKGWPRGALTRPAQPPASWRTSERTFVWAAKLNLPPSCQGIGKAVRREGKGERGGRSSGREGTSEEGSSEPQLFRHCLPRKLHLQAGAAWAPGTEAGTWPPISPGWALGARRPWPRPRTNPYPAPGLPLPDKVEQDGRGGKSLPQVEG